MLLRVLDGLPGVDDEVGREGGGAVEFGGTTEGADVVGFELPEVVFGLGVHEAERCGSIGFAVDVGDTIRIAGDGYILRKIAWLGRSEGDGKEKCGGDSH